MNTVYVISAIPCDTAYVQLPLHPTLPGNYQITINPNPYGDTGQLYIAVTCSINPGPTASIDYRLTLQTTTDWRFSGTNPAQLNFTRLATSGIPEYLPFILNNLVPSGTTIPAVILVEAWETLYPPVVPSSQIVSLAE